MITLAVFLLQAIAPCPPADIKYVGAIDHGTMIRHKNVNGQCITYVAVPEGTENVRLRIALDTAVSNARFDQNNAGTVADTHPTTLIAVLPVTPGQSQTFTFSAIRGNRTVNHSFRISAPVNLTVNPQAACAAGTVCIDAATETRLILQGQRLDQVRGNSVLLITQQSVTPVTFRKGADHLELTIPAGISLRDGALYSIVASLMEHELIDGAVRDTIRSESFRLTIRPGPARRVTLLAPDGSSRVERVYIRQPRDVLISMSNDNKLDANTYTLTEKDSADVVGFLEVFANQSGRVTMTKEPANGLVPTNLTGYPGKFRLYLRALAQPSVTSVKIQGSAGKYGSDTLRTGVQSTVVVTGPQAGAFEPYDHSGAPILKLSSHGINNELRFNITPRIGTAGDLNVVLRAPESVDTTIRLPVGAHLRVRDLNFIGLAHRVRKFGCMTTLTDTAKLPGEANISACSMADLALVFDTVADTSDLFGPQYLKIYATLYNPSDGVEKRDSARWVISPPGSDVHPGYESASVLPMRRLIGNLGRFSQPGSSVKITIQHDPDRYGNTSGRTATMHVMDSRRFGLSGSAGITPVTWALARLDERKATVRQELNGTSGDSLISSRMIRNWKSKVITPGAFAALDARFYFSDSRATLIKLRIAGLSMESPYSDKNALVAALMYPVELDLTRFNGHVVKGICAACRSLRSYSAGLM